MSSLASILECRGGMRQECTVKTLVVVVVELWPSWVSFCSPETGLSCIVVSYGATAPIHDWPELFANNVKLFNPSLWQRFSAASLALISGSSYFVEQVMCTLPPTWSFICALSLDHEPTSKLEGLANWFRLRHESFGGVTSGHWWFGSKDGNMKAPSGTRSQLRLGHPLSDTKGGRPHPPPDDPDEIFDAVTYVTKPRVLHPGGFLPIKALRSRVLCHDVYSPTRWVVRPLSVHELGRCYDVTEHGLQALPDKSLQRVALGGLPFISGPPGRLLLAVVEAWRDQLERNQANDGGSTPNDNISVPSGALEPVRHISPLPTTLEEDCFGREKAAKNDDADILVAHWDRRALSLWEHNSSVMERVSAFSNRFTHDPLTAIRKGALNRWCHNVFRGLRRYMNKKYPSSWITRPHDKDAAHEWSLDMEASRDCLQRAVGATWWDWEAGSRLFFWRWPKEAQRWARDGLPIYHHTHLLPRYRTCQPPEADPVVRVKVQEKIQKFREKGYISRGTVCSLRMSI